MAQSDSSVWPFFGLKIRSPRLELRVPYESEISDLARVVADFGVHERHEMPFMSAWALEESPKLERGIFKYHMKMRAEMSQEQWNLAFGVFLNGKIIGLQALSADQFEVAKRVSTGSWLDAMNKARVMGPKCERRSCALPLNA